jgi:hypothetical protein
MNAYELADDVKNISNTIEALEWVQKASPLLRQQADRIAELEKDLHMLQRHYDQLDHDTQGNYELILMDEHDVVVRMPIEEWQSIIESPQIKELSDEDVHKLWASENGLEDFDMCKFDGFLQTFRFMEKAILKKASEK